MVAGEKYRMPAEWEPQEAVWLTWPENKETWPDNLAAAQIEFTALVHSLAEMVLVRVLVNQPSLEHAYETLIRPDIRNVGLINIPTNDAWARDYAPTFVVAGDRIAGEPNTGDDQKLVAIDWDYNAWGGKYPPFEDDQKVAAKVADGMKIDVLRPELCFEGGAVETNGAGVVLSTISCAGDANRNEGPQADLLKRFESVFEQYLGAENTVWLAGAAIEGDDTDGHIDQLVRFTDATTLVYAWCDSDNSQYPSLSQNLADLKAGLDQLEATFQLVALPIPEQAIEFFGRRVPASYCNFLITNELVVVPQFGCAEDGQALEILKPLFPDRYVVGLPSRNLVVGLGSFHCLTQQQPQLS
jgi:agmatine deiminase